MAIALLIEHQDVARDIDVRVVFEKVLQSQDEIDHLIAVGVGLSHRPTVRRGIIHFAFGSKIQI